MILDFSIINYPSTHPLNTFDSIWNVGVHYNCKKMININIGYNILHYYNNQVIRFQWRKSRLS